MEDMSMLESLEFYRRRYENFSTLLIIPVFALVVALALFSFVGTREITVKVLGEIAPADTVALVQSTSGEAIVANNLEENKEVRKGDTLLAYDSDSQDTQLTDLQRQLDVARRQQSALDRVIQALDDDTVPIDEADEFGYSSMVADFRAQRSAMRSDDEVQRRSVTNQNATVAASRQAVDEQIAASQTRIGDYAQLREAVASGGTLAQDNVFASTYALYRSQLEQLASQAPASSTASTSVGGEELTLRNKTLADIDAAVQELQSGIDALETQRASVGSMTPQPAGSSESIEALRAQYRLNADKELAGVKTTIAQLETNVTLSQGSLEKSVVLAPADGVLHVNPQVLGMPSIAAGTTVAQIYPKLEERTALDIVFGVPATDISEVRVGQEVRLRSYQRTAKPLVIVASVRSIASSSTRSEQGNAFEVHARVKSQPDQLDRLRYGLQGDTVIVTGRKTFFAYYRDKLLNP